MKIVSLIYLFFAINAFAGTSKFFYSTSSQSFSLKNIFINPYDNKSVAPTGVSTFVINNVIDPKSETMGVYNLANPAQYTGLATAENTTSLTTKNESFVNGNSFFQAQGNKFGLFLNLAQVSKFPFALPNSSVQLVYNFNPYAKIWANSADTMFCASGNANLYQSILGSNLNLSNQQSMAYIFRDTKSGKEFWYSVNFYDSRPSLIPDDFVMADNPNDTGLPIVISFLKKQGGNSAFVRDIPGYGNPLRPYYSGANQNTAQDFGGCIQRNQFVNMIKTIQKTYASYANLSTNLSDYALTHFNFSLEIYHNYTFDRKMGMSVNSLYLYTRNDAQASIPNYGSFYSGSQNIAWACNVSSSQQNLSGWVDQGNGCYHHAVNELANQQNQVASCSFAKSYCTPDNKIEEYFCGCSAGLASPFYVNDEKDASGNVYRRCYRYKTSIPCIY